MILGEFGTKPYSEFLQTGCVGRALTGHVGVEYGGKIATTPSMYVNEHVGILGFHLGCLQYTQPRRYYRNVNSWYFPKK